MTVLLQRMSVVELEDFAHGTRDAPLSMPPDEATLLPPHVVQRSLKLYAAGGDASWCFPYRIVSTAHACIVGNCGFKGEAEKGEVEIGYGVAPAYQRQGLATAAVAALLKLAFGDASVESVLATINPGNAASIRVAEKLGFVKQDRYVDDDGETLIRWRRFR